LSDQEKSPQQKLATVGENIILRARVELAKAILARVEGAGPSELADLAYAVACVEGARRGVLPGSPPPKKS
jgi:hypothetical protein